MLTMNTLLLTKLIIAGLIAGFSLCGGLLSVRFIERFPHWMRYGDAFSRGIFLGAALFHLFPTALHGFQQLNTGASYGVCIALALVSFLILWLLEKAAYRIGMLIFALCFHAAVAGLTVGLALAFNVVIVLFVAIIAHKGFEMFALTLKSKPHLSAKALRVLIFLFSWVTPLGIVLAGFADTLLKTSLDSLLTAGFSAFAAGTFLYIGLLHKHQDNGYAGQPALVYSWFGIGAAIMAIIAIWF